MNYFYSATSYRYTVKRASVLAFMYKHYVKQVSVNRCLNCQALGIVFLDYHHSKVCWC